MKLLIHDKIRRIGLISLLVGSVGLCFVLSGFSFFLFANFTANIMILGILSVLIFGLLNTAAGAVFARFYPLQHKQRFILLYTALLMIVLVFSIYFTINHSKNPPIKILAVRADTQYWTLRDGYQIGYTHLPAKETPKPTPILYLHGGPGAVPHDRSFGDDYGFLEQFTADGFDVYIYDQIGSGRSDFLPNIAEYTVHRNLDDLEDIRQILGVEKMILIGQSWGGQLAARYLAVYPEHIEKVIFTSPGKLFSDSSFPYLYDQTAGEEIDLNLSPRELTAINLLSINPEAAQNILPQMEANLILENVGNLILRQSFCKQDRDRVPELTSEQAFGFNFYANQLTRTQDVDQDILLSQLKTVSVPVLILKGECDFVPLAATEVYAQVLPNAKMQIIENTGHLLWGGQWQKTTAVIRTFLSE